ncbi:efflux RND transporter periplasmic adaptor subunit [Capilliphycus salinus ALCB114379]|uniref:efflux RND transporter periplasmic adaptor subunit n=1 Tax=Capilliphycus salinus TaxID=2768948 RepID=UPI0039A4DBE6
MSQTPPVSTDSQLLNQSKPEYFSAQDLESIPDLQSVEESSTPANPRRWLGLFFLVMVFGSGLTVWNLIKSSESQPALSNAQTPPPRPVTVTRLQTGTPVEKLQLIGQVEASEQATIRSQVDGTVQEVLVKVGDRITPGTTVAILDNTDQQLALREAEARLAGELSRLAELQAGTRSEILSQRQAQLRSAQTREQEARDYLRRTQELAPKLVAQRQAELQAAIAREQEARSNLIPTQELAPKRIAQRQAELQSAVAREQEAQDNLERISSLVESGVQSQRILVEAQSAVDRAVAERLAASAALTAMENETQQDLISAQANIDTAVGERLEAEAVLATVETENQRNIAAAQAALDAAIEEKLRVEAELAEAQAGPRPEEIAAQQSLVKAAEAAVNQARVNLQRTEIKSPSAGVVRSRAVNGSDYVERSDPILTLVSEEQVDIFLEVPESLSGAVSVGLPVNLTARALEGWTQTSRIDAVVPATDTTSRRQLVRVSLENPPVGLLPGMAIQADLEVPVEMTGNSDSFVVPRDALVRRGNEWLLFTVADNKVQSVTVEVLADLGEEMAIANEQLQANQTIVLKGGDGLQNGSVISVTSHQSPVTSY